MLLEEWESRGEEEEEEAAEDEEEDEEAEADGETEDRIWASMGLSTSTFDGFRSCV